jgi:hypothetical protein
MTFFSLRGWGKHKSGVLTTEQVYIHGKTCIIDDRESSYYYLLQCSAAPDTWLMTRTRSMWICEYQ